MTLLLQTDFKQVYPGIFNIHTEPCTEAVAQDQYDGWVSRMRSLENQPHNR